MAGESDKDSRTGDFREIKTLQEQAMDILKMRPEITAGNSNAGGKNDLSHMLTKHK